MSRGHFVGVDYHRLMLADRVRMDAFFGAIRTLVKPGDVVYDIGAGLGVMGLFAARAGAGRVYLVESSPILEIARQVAEYNGITNVDFIQGDARQCDVPEPGDLAVCEGIGNFFVTDEMQSVYRAIPRFLKPTGRIIPNRVTLYLAPAFILTFNGVNFWAEEPIGGIDFSPVSTWAANRAYVVNIPEGFLIAPPQVFARISIPDVPDTLAGDLEFRVTRPGMRLTGFVGWFSADLAPGVVLDTRPGIRTHWGQMLFPVQEMTAPENSTIRLHMDLRMDANYRSVFQWSGTVDGPGGVTKFSHSSARRFQSSAVAQDFLRS